MTHDVTVDLGDRSYPIRIGSGILETLGAECRAVGLTGRCLVVSDETVAPLYAARALNSLRAAGLEPALEVVPAGEPTKCHEQLQRLYARAADSRLDRRCFMVALGGGVVGDLTGFAAASWLRGIRFVQVPTTLLAMVDSSVGGKTGINIPAGKNLVGAFHQPELVLMDLETLQTLPAREFAAGMCEVAKYGMIWDVALLSQLERVEVSPDASILPEVVARCCEIKAEVVRQDEREGGLRGILNFGHTLGHAIETVAGYGRYLHGEAVAVGMVYAARLAAPLELCGAADDAARIERLLVALHLPVAAPELAWSDLRAAMAVDKKTIGGQVQFVLLDRIGHAVLGCNRSEEQMKAVWDGMPGAG